MGSITSGPLPKRKRKPASASAAAATAGRHSLPPGYPAAIRPMFDQLVEQLSAHGIVPVDLYALADAAFYQWQKVECMRVLMAEGVSITDTAHGDEKRKHPMLAAHRQADMQFQKLCIQFGMTPASRARLMPPEQDDEDPYKDFLNGKAGAAGKAASS